MAAWVYLYFPDMYLHSILSGNDVPTVVVTADSQRVLQVSNLAQQQGIQVDMPLSNALFLSPELCCHTLDPEYAMQLLQQRALWAYRYSAQVFTDPPHGVWLEAGSMLRLFGGLTAFVETIQKSCQVHAWPLQLGMGQTPLAARWMALADVNVMTLDHEPQKEALNKLPLSELHLEDKQLLALQRLGLRTLGELLALPLAEVGRRICPALMKQLRDLHGSQVPPASLFKPALTFSDRALFNHDVEHHNGLLFPLTRLLNSLCGFLHHHQLSVRWLALRLLHREPPETRWLFEFASHEHRYDELLQLCRYQLEKQSLRAPVTELQLSVTQFTPREHAQIRCLDTQARKQGSGTLINRLQAKLSTQQISVLRGTGDARPECAWQAIAADQSSSDAHWNRADRAGDWPLWLLPTPQPWHPPKNIVKGPLRISGGWWDTSHIRRDYYQVLHDAQLIWVFRDDQKQWFLHGYFS